MISKANAQKLAWLWQDENKVAWIESFIKIADKEGKLVPFILTDEQKELVQNMQSNNIILKSRQLGISSITIALSIRECVVHENTTCFLVSHNQSSCNTIFDKLKQQYHSLPDIIKPKLIGNNRQALCFDNGSKITCLTAGNKEIGRGDTLNGIVHLSEFAFWKNADKQLHALSQAVSESGRIIIESTANGFNKFSELYIQAKNGDNSYKPFFFNWINGKSLFANQYEQAVAEYEARTSQKIKDMELDEDEQELLKMGASLAQIAWRRKKVSTDGLDTFQVEYPSTDTECFLTTGQQLFDSKRITASLTTIVENKIKPLAKKQVTGIPTILMPYLGKTFHIWQLPRIGEKYYIGVDCSEGLGQDYSTAIVLNREGQQVAEFRNNKIKPYQYADVLNALGRYYNKALLTVEKASGGHSVIERLRYEQHYMNMTKYKTYDEFQRTIWRVGFDTNNKTKSIIVNDCREWFDKGLIQIKSKDMLEEMKVFVANDNGSMGAISGSHDDLVMGLCLCIQGMKNGLWYPF